VIVMFNQC